MQKSCHCIKSKAKFMPIFSYNLSASEGLCPQTPYQGFAPGPQSDLSEPPLLDSELCP